MAKSIGERVKALRAEQKLTLAELAERAGVSTSYLSQVERDKITPSLATLTVMAGALDVQVRYFFETAAEAAFVIRSEDGDLSGGGALFTAGPGDVSQEQLVPVGPARLVVNRLRIPPGGTSGQLAPSPCEEFLFVLSGSVFVTVGEECFSLGAGDSLHYDAAQPHAWRNDSGEVCSVIWGSAGGPPEL